MVIVIQDTTSKACSQCHLNLQPVPKSPLSQACMPYTPSDFPGPCVEQMPHAPYFKPLTPSAAKTSSSSGEGHYRAPLLLPLILFVLFLVDIDPFHLLLHRCSGSALRCAVGERAQRLPHITKQRRCHFQGHLDSAKIRRDMGPTQSVSPSEYAH